MAQKAAETGPGAMGLVAMEQMKFPKSRRIIDDDLAYRILPLGMRVAIQMKASPFPGNFITNRRRKRSPVSGAVSCAGNGISMTRYLKQFRVARSKRW